MPQKNFSTNYLPAPKPSLIKRAYFCQKYHQNYPVMRTPGFVITLITAAAMIMGTAPGNQSSAQVFVGGDVNITFLGGFNADIAPIIGYKYQKFSAGLSPVLMYTVTGNMAGDFAYGGRLFAEYTVYKGFFAHAEFGAMYANFINWDDVLGAVKERNWVLSAPVGAGYEVQVAKNVFFKTMLLYDALLDLDLNQSSPLANPSVRGGFVYVL
jgi:hypothetical protein